MHADATETAVIIPVPAAEPVVAEHRARLDVAASWGVPAHLYPFAPPDTDRPNSWQVLATLPLG